MRHAVSGTTAATVALAATMLAACASPEDRAWDAVRRRESLEGQRKYLAKLPEGAHTSAVRARVGELEGDRAWQRARQEETLAAYEAYVAAHEEGRHFSVAERRIATICDERAWAAAQERDTVDASTS